MIHILFNILTTIILLFYYTLFFQLAWCKSHGMKTYRIQILAWNSQQVKAKYKPRPTVQPYREMVEIVKSAYENLFKFFNKQLMNTMIIIAT